MGNNFRDKILICVDCNEEFVFTVSAQEYFAQKGFADDPKRCKSCYLELKRNKRRSPADATVQLEETDLVEESLGISSDDFGEDNSGNRASIK